jgi:AcrR family transcriptional regulator
LDKQTILAAALKLAETLGYRWVFKRHLSKSLACGMGTINYHWGTMDELRGAIVREAIATGNRQIVTQAIALRDPLVWRKNLSPALRLKLDAMSLV